MNFPLLLKMNCWSSNEALIPTLKEIPKEIDSLPVPPPPSYKLLAQWHICLIAYTFNLQTAYTVAYMPTCYMVEALLTFGTL